MSIRSQRRILKMLAPDLPTDHLEALVSNYADDADYYGSFDRAMDFASYVAGYMAGHSTEPTATAPRS